MADDVQVTPRGVGQLLKANTTLMVWLVFLAFGGGILSLYYAGIRYLPDVEWKSSLVYLAVASFIGGGVGLLFALSVFLPGLIWAESLLCDPRLVGTFSYSNGEPCLRTVLRLLGVPFGLALLISHSTLGMNSIEAVAKHAVIIYSVVTVALLIRTFIIMRLIFGRLLAEESVCDRLEQALPKGIFRYSVFILRCIFWPLPPSTQPAVSDARKKGPTASYAERHIFKYSSWFTLSVFLSQISILIVYCLSGWPGGVNFVVHTVICTSGVLISNHAVAVRYHHYPRQAIGASLVAAALLLVAANHFSSLSQGILAFYGFGTGNRVNLLVNEEGAAIIEQLGLPCHSVPPTGGLLVNVEILSKLGGEYYLRVGPCDRNAGRTLTLPKSTVRSFVSADENSSKANQGSPPQ